VFLQRPLAAALTALALLCSGPPLAVRAQLSGVEPALKRLEQQLRQAWRQDPFTAQRPFPKLRLLSGPGDSPCHGPYGAADPLVRVCAGGRKLQLDRQPLAALEGLSEEAGVAFALAYGLGLSLVPPQPPQPPGAPGPQAIAGLQAACAAGSLLGRAGRRPRTRPGSLEPWKPPPRPTARRPAAGVSAGAGLVKMFLPRCLPVLLALGLGPGCLPALTVQPHSVLLAQAVDGQRPLTAKVQG
jgi:hypothetical protein